VLNDHPVMVCRFMLERQMAAVPHVVHVRDDALDGRLSGGCLIQYRIELAFQFKQFLGVLWQVHISALCCLVRVILPHNGDFIAGVLMELLSVASALQSKLVSQDNAIKKHAANQANRKAATRKFGTRLTTRTKRVAAKSIAAIPAESIPFIGVAVLIADTGYELYAACETVRDLDQLYSDLGMADGAAEDVMHSVCDPE
jgi:hypothetical protein